MSSEVRSRSIASSASAGGPGACGVQRQDDVLLRRPSTTAPLMWLPVTSTTPAGYAFIHGLQNVSSEPATSTADASGNDDAPGARTIIACCARGRAHRIGHGRRKVRAPPSGRPSPAPAGSTRSSSRRAAVAGATGQIARSLMSWAAQRAAWALVGTLKRCMLLLTCGLT